MCSDRLVWRGPSKERILKPLRPVSGLRDRIVTLDICDVPPEEPIARLSLVLIVLLFRNSGLCDEQTKQNERDAIKPRQRNIVYTAVLGTGSRAGWIQETYV